jgi:hypothetical protein
MKLAIRAFALTVVIAGAAAAVSSSSTHATIQSHQALTSGFPVPGCGPKVPSCPQK